MELTPELRKEKAVEHLLVFARFVANEYCQDNASSCDVLCAAAARVFRATHHQELTPIDWVANSFAEKLRELVIDAGPLKLPED